MDMVIIIYAFIMIMLFILYNNNIKSIYYDVIIAIISCNRIRYLNLSTLSILKHLKYYERRISTNIINFDQGTPNRRFILNKYKIKNIFNMNPCGYAYSFSLLFSYLYTKFVLLLEEDWVIRNNIETRIKYSNFLFTSMKLLSNSNFIYGLYLRHHPKGNSTKRIDRQLNITYYEVIQPWEGFCFTNGASMYKSYHLKIMKYGASEYQTARRCLRLNYHIGYIFWEYKNSDRGIEYPFIHIGDKTTKSGICNISLY